MAVAAEIADCIDYLCEHGRGAVLPDVRHRIQTSRHFPDMSEVRTDQNIDGCLGGNKDRYEIRSGGTGTTIMCPLPT